MTAKPKAPSCPACGSADVVPIIRGMPSFESEEAANRGEAVLGGCRVSDDSTVWSCRVCKHEFGRFGAP